MRPRGLGAAALRVSAALHSSFDGVRNHIVGPMFLTNVIAGMVITGMLLPSMH